MSLEITVARAAWTKIVTNRLSFKWYTSIIKISNNSIPNLTAHPVNINSLKNAINYE